MQQSFLKIKDLNKTYADKQALKNINLTIEKGSIYGLIGQNGAGKTTLIRIINKIIEADNGEVFLNDTVLKMQDVLNIGYLPEERGLYKNMTIEEQALYFGQLKGMSKQEAKTQLNKWLQRFDILDWKNKKINKLSKGMAQKVQFIITVLHEPDLIILDEPFSGLDPVNASLIAYEIKNLAIAGKTIIFSSHRMESVTDMCNRVCLIHQGQILLEGALSEIQNKYIKEVYKVGLVEVNKTLLDNFKTSEYTVDTLEEQNDFVVLEISSSEKIENNTLLQELMEFAKIQSFEQNKPTLQDIFIKTIANA